MPTYEYACRSCGQHLEVVQSFRDDPLTSCPHCEGELRKVFSAAGLIFKGSGWHVTDYGRNGSKRDSAPSESGSKGSDDPSGGSEATSDSSSGTGKATSDSSSATGAAAAADGGA